LKEEEDILDISGDEKPHRVCNTAGAFVGRTVGVEFNHTSRPDPHLLFKENPIDEHAIIYNSISVSHQHFHRLQLTMSYDPSSMSPPYFGQSLSPYTNARQLPQRTQPKLPTKEAYDWKYMAESLLEEMKSMIEHMRMTRKQWQEEREQWLKKPTDVET
jgi:hypothetical protein